MNNKTHLSYITQMMRTTKFVYKQCSHVKKTQKQGHGQLSHLICPTNHIHNSALSVSLHHSKIWPIIRMLLLSFESADFVMCCVKMLVIFSSTPFYTNHIRLPQVGDPIPGFILGDPKMHYMIAMVPSQPMFLPYVTLICSFSISRVDGKGQ